MANGMFNIGRGRFYHSYLDGDDIIIILLKVAEADDTLNNYDDLDALLMAAGNTEADFTNYARKTVSNASVTPTVDDSGNTTSLDVPDQTWTSAGGASNNTLVKLLACIDGASDALRVPVTHYDFAVTTDGNDLIAQVNASGLWQSS